MYLSRLWLNPRDRAVQRDLADLQGMHRTVMSAFPHQESLTAGPRASLAVLFREEQDPKSNRSFLLVQSRLLPDWSALPPGYLLVPPLDEPLTRPLLPFLERVQAGNSFRFRIRANPTRKIAEKDPGSGLHARGKRVDLRGEEDQRAWLERKGQQHGFRVEAVQVQDEPRVTGRRSRESDARMVVIAPVLYQGILQVTDPATFRQGIEQGIGPAKSYGCGLLSVAPAGV